MITPGRFIVGNNITSSQRIQENYTDSFTTSKIIEVLDTNELNLIKPTSFMFAYVKESQRLYYYNNSWISITKIAQNDPTDITKSDYIITSGSKFYNVDTIDGTSNYIQNKEPYSPTIAADMTVKYLDDSNSFSVALKNDQDSWIVRITNYTEETVVELQGVNIDTLFSGNIGTSIRIRLAIDNSNLYIKGFDSQNNQLFTSSVPNSIQVNTLRIYPKINGNVNTNYVMVNSIYSEMTSQDRTTFMFGGNSGFSVTPRRWL